MTSKTEAPRKKLPRACLVIYALTAVSLLLYFCFTKSIGFSDWFNQHVSHHLRKLLALLGAWIPFSLAELLILCVPLLFVLILVIGSRRFCDSNRSALVYIGILFSSICVIGILFVWNFAAGYYGSRLDEKLELERQKSSADDLYQTAELIRTEMNKLLNDLERKSSGLRYRIFGALQRADVDGFAPLPPRPKQSGKNRNHPAPAEAEEE